jgi:hypothetical protein
MATLENVRLAITPLATKPGFSRIAYSYELHPSELDCAEQREYSMKTSLWGEDLIDDDVLALEKDAHKVVFDDSKPGKPVVVQRAFEIETKTLDEDVFGEDEVYLIVEASSGRDPDTAGENLIMGRSNTVKGDF